jgi:hypothetical protein
MNSIHFWPPSNNERFGIWIYRYMPSRRHQRQMKVAKRPSSALNSAAFAVSLLCYILFGTVPAVAQVRFEPVALELNWSGQSDAKKFRRRD